MKKKNISRLFFGTLIFVWTFLLALLCIPNNYEKEYKDAVAQTDRLNSQYIATIKEYEQVIKDKELIIDDIKNQMTNSEINEYTGILVKMYNEYTGLKIYSASDPEFRIFMNYGIDSGDYIYIEEGLVSSEDGSLLKYIFTNFDSITCYESRLFYVAEDDKTVDVINYQSEKTNYNRDKLNLSFNFFNENGFKFDINQLTDNVLYQYEFRNVNYIANETFTLSCDVFVKVCE